MLLDTRAQGSGALKAKAARQNRGHAVNQLQVTVSQVACRSRTARKDPENRVTPLRRRQVGLELLPTSPSPPAPRK